MPSDALLPVPVGAQWRMWSQAGPVYDFAPNAFAPNTGGNSYLKFPNGARVWGVSIQSAVKTFPHETLMSLVVGPKGNDIHEAGSFNLVNNHNMCYGDASVVSKTIFLPKPVIINPGWLVWIWANGWAGYRSNDPVLEWAFEVQAHLYVDADVVAEWPAKPIWTATSRGISRNQFATRLDN